MQAWQRKGVSFWTHEVHAYMDNKKFLLPTTPELQKKVRQMRCKGHLRKAFEGLLKGCMKPKAMRSYTGCRSMEVTCAVTAKKAMTQITIEMGGGNKA